MNAREGEGVGRGVEGRWGEDGVEEEKKGDYRRGGGGRRKEG